MQSGVVSACSGRSAKGGASRRALAADRDRAPGAGGQTPEPPLPPTQVGSFRLRMACTRVAPCRGGGPLSLVPLLVVRDAARAIDFYVRALRAREVVRFVNRKDGSVSHADWRLARRSFPLTEEARAFNSDAPPSLGGSPVVLQLKVDSVDAAFEAMCAAGATIVFPMVEFCGERMGACATRMGNCGCSSSGSRSCRRTRCSGGVMRGRRLGSLTKT